MFQEATLIEQWVHYLDG